MVNYFSKPKHLKYTDMCIYIDTHIKNGDYDPEKVFIYLYHLCYMLASIGKFFHKSKDYADFAIYSAETVYFRLIDPNRVDENDTSGKPKKIKSVLNYLKATIYPLKTVYQNSTFSQSFVPSKDNKCEEHLTEELDDLYVSDIQNKESLMFDIEDSFNLIRIYLRKLLAFSPYQKNKLTKRYLTISVLATLLNRLDFSTVQLDRLANRQQSGKELDKLILTFLAQNQQNKVVVYNLPKELSSYINYLCNCLLVDLGDEMASIIDAYTATEEEKNEIRQSSFEAYKGGK